MPRIFTYRVEHYKKNTVAVSESMQRRNGVPVIRIWSFVLLN